jgi:flagellar hook assembly protein FlgD
VAFDMAEPGRVNLEVHDARGALVHVLADAFYGAGSYEIAWNGRDNLGRGVGSGIYFVHFASGSFRSSQKIVLLK